MRIVLIGFGSRGDVQPLLALAQGLQNANYEVAIAAGANFRGMVEEAGFAYEYLRTDIQALMNSDSGKEWIENSTNPLIEAQNMKRMIAEVGVEVAEDFLKVSQNADVLVSGLPSFGIVDAIAHKYNKKHITVLFAPLNPTYSHAATMVPMIPRRNIFINRVSGYIGQYFTYWIFKDVINQFRDLIGMPPLNYSDYARAYNHDVPVIYGLSPHVMEHPEDWADHIYVTGYWFYDAQENWQAPQALCDFLEGGAPPVYIGFGSMSNKNPQATTEMMIDALKQTAQRGIIHSGWANLQTNDLPDHIYMLDYAPHDWLFPQMAAIIHHGGAGTTAAALVAGIPNTVVSHMADQPYWGRRVYELGVGASPIQRKDLSSERLAQAISKTVNNPTMQKNATALGAKIRSEDGVANAVKAFKTILK